MESVTFELSKSVEYKMGNDDINGSHVELREPMGKVSHICCQIESLIQAGVMNMASMLGDDMIAEAKEEAKSENKKEDESTKLDAESALRMMTSGGADMGKITLFFDQLFKEVAFIGGEKQMTQSILDRMSHKDKRSMMGEYTANFIML